MRDQAGGIDGEVVKRVVQELFLRLKIGHDSTVKWRAGAPPQSLFEGDVISDAYNLCSALDEWPEWNAQREKPRS